MPAVWSGDPSPVYTVLSPMMPACYGVADAIKSAVGCLNAKDDPDYECISVPTECVPVVVSVYKDSLCVVDDTEVSPVNAADNVPYECISVVVSGSMDSSCVVDGTDASPVNSTVDSCNETPDVQSVSDEDMQSNRGRKRVRCEDNWKTNVRKRQRNSGLSYVDRRGRQKCARILKPGCVLKCNKKCHHYLTQEQRESLFQSFWQLGSLERQRDYISRYVSWKKNRRNGRGRIKSRCQYEFSVDGVRIIFVKSSSCILCLLVRE